MEKTRQLQEELLQSWMAMEVGIRGNRLLSDLSMNEMLICNILYQRRDDAPVTATELCGQTKLLKSQMNHILNTMSVRALGAALLVCVFVRTFAPRMILPQLDIPNMVLISLVALVADHYLAPGAKRCYVCIPVFSALTFGLLPFAACFVGVMDAVKLALFGGIIFTVVTWLYSSVQDRLSSGPAAKAAPAISALGLYLAVQCFAGLLL